MRPEVYLELREQWRAKNPLKLWRDANKITFRQIPEILGIPWPTYVKWELGTGRPSRDPEKATVTAFGKKYEWDDWMYKHTGVKLRDFVNWFYNIPIFDNARNR